MKTEIELKNVNSILCAKIETLILSGDDEVFDEENKSADELKMAEKAVTPLDLTSMLGLKKKEGISDNIVKTLIVKTEVSVEPLVTFIQYSNWDNLFKHHFLF